MDTSVSMDVSGIMLRRVTMDMIASGNGHQKHAAAVHQQTTTSKAGSARERKKRKGRRVRGEKKRVWRRDGVKEKSLRKGE